MWKKVSREKGFEILACKTHFANLSLEKVAAGTLQCVEQLAPRIDAFYITDHRGQTVEQIDNLLKPLLRYKIPTWAQSGSEFVKRGVLFSTTQVEYDEYGFFYTKVIAGLINGKKIERLQPDFRRPEGTGRKWDYRSNNRIQGAALNTPQCNRVYYQDRI